MLAPGSSFHSSIALLKALPAPVPAFNQIEIQPWHQPRHLIQYCLSHHILLIAFCPLARASSERLADPVIAAISRRTGKSWGQVILRWSLQKGYIPIPRTQSVQRVRENADLWGFELTAEEMERVDGLCLSKERDEELGEGCSAPNAWKLFSMP